MNKRLTLFALIVATVLPTFAQKTVLSGTLSGAAEGVSLVVSTVNGGKLVPTDTVAVDARGRYRIERQTADEVFFTLSLNQPQSPLVHIILLPNEKVTLDMNYRIDNNYLLVTSVKGSDNMRVYQSYNNLVNDASATPNGMSAVPAALEQLLRDNSAELMSAFLVTYFESAFEQYYDLYKAVRDGTKPRYPNNEFVKHIDQRVSSVIAVGSEAPDIVMAGIDGTDRRLSDLRGKVVLIDFWASWCRPCRAENPNVVRLYHAYKDKGFDIFSVSLDNSRDKWLQAIQADGLVWPNHVSDLKGWSSAGGRLYGIMSIPATVLLDREGRVVARNLRGAQLEQKVKELLGE